MQALNDANQLYAKPAPGNYLKNQSRVVINIADKNIP